MQNAIDQVGSIHQKTPGVARAIELAGFSIVAGAWQAKAGMGIAIMDPRDRRPSDQAVPALIAKLAPVFNASPEA